MLLKLIAITARYFSLVQNSYMLPLKYLSTGTFKRILLKHKLIYLNFLHSFRKVCLKLLKYLLQQLKNNDSKSTKMSSFCSYHAKTTLLHACASRGTDSEWAYSQLANCFQQLLEDFVKHLRNHQLPNFFIPSHNLLNHVSTSNCDFLAKEIELQLNNNFPIFS